MRGIMRMAMDQQRKTIDELLAEAREVKARPGPGASPDSFHYQRAMAAS